MAHRPGPSKLVALIKRYRISWAVLTLAPNALAIILVVFTGAEPTRAERHASGTTPARPTGLTR